MIRAIRTLSAAAIVGAGLSCAPAFAGGSLSVSYTPADPHQAHALHKGLRLYGLVDGIKSGSITQNGSGNAAGLIQNGQGNLGIIHQDGDGHDGTLQQNGNGNAYGLFQFGRNTQGHVVQHGDDETGATVQFGW